MIIVSLIDLLTVIYLDFGISSSTQIHNFKKIQSENSYHFWI